MHAVECLFDSSAVEFDPSAVEGLFDPCAVECLFVGAVVVPNREGSCVGAAVGTFDGVGDGLSVGTLVGSADGLYVGLIVGSRDGTIVGACDGSVLGKNVCHFVIIVGTAVGAAVFW